MGLKLWPTLSTYTSTRNGMVVYYTCRSNGECSIVGSKQSRYSLVGTMKIFSVSTERRLFLYIIVTAWWTETVQCAHIYRIATPSLYNYYSCGTK